jgi:hypothetical protein
LIVSLEDAVSLLRKWESDDAPVSALAFSDDGLSFSLAGFISAINPSLVSICHMAPDAERLGELTIQLPGVIAFDYKDVREAKESVRAQIASRISSSLHMRLKHSECTLYELVPHADTE